jgi:dTDP-4-dehydrorhamnose 3,5-epimerase
MKIIETKLKGVLEILPDVFQDDRGYFFESYSQQKYTDFNSEKFVQDNISKSKKGTIRGLHYQVRDNAQGKLCQVIYGNVFDVAVDIRFNSPTFGEFAAIELSEVKHNQIWIPPGFAHGFSVLSDIAIFHYKCTAYYNKEDEKAIIYNDPNLGIDWKVLEPNVSEKDLKATPFKEIDKDFFYNL